MKTTALKLRWIYAACYEIVLPSGATIVIDPFITPNNFENFSWTNITGADYILLTHTHFDHISDVGNLVKKYNSRVIAESTAAYELANCFSFNYDNVYPAAPTEKYYFEDFILEVQRSKHNVAPKPEPQIGPKDRKIPGLDMPGVGNVDLLNEYGSIYSLDYFITTKENVRIMISSGALYDGSGKLIYDNAFVNANGFAPNIVIRQATRLGAPEFFAKVLSRYNAQIYFPFHHEAHDRRKARMGSDVMGTDEYLTATDAELQKISSAHLINPTQFKWYEINTTVNELD